MALDTTEFLIYFGLVFWFFQFLADVLLNLPYVIIEKYQLFQHLKIQPQQKNLYGNVKADFLSKIKSQLIIMLPITLLACTLPFSQSIVYMYYQPMPILPIIVLQFFMLRMFADILFYSLHRWLHTPWAYKRIHKIHHELHAPNAIQHGYAHPVEAYLTNIFPYILSVIVVGLSPLGPVHIWVALSALIVLEWRSVEAHCGYVLPWHIDRFKIFNWINGGSVWHDAHHSDFHYNFGVRWLDKLFQTDMETYKNKHA